MNCRTFIIFLFSGFSYLVLNAQGKVVFRLLDADRKESIPAAIVKEHNKTCGISDSLGIVNISLSQGTHVLEFRCIGYYETEIKLEAPFTGIQTVYMKPTVNALDEVSVVASARNNQKIENSPLKVEVLGKEEMNEENVIKPANIVGLLSDVSGVQIQQSSAVSGNSNVRIQGLDGRYTQVLRDGMPLYEGFSGGFGILSIPPLDLKQVELIKGSASTLYGGGAIGGLVNIISKTPGNKQQVVATINQTTLAETNLNTFLSKKYEHLGYTFYAGFTRQMAVDVNKDGFSDTPELNSLVIHPKLFWYLDDNTLINAGYSVTVENRLGGDMLVIDKKPDLVHQFFEKNTTNRQSGEIKLERRFNENIKLEFKNSFSSFNRRIFTNTHSFNGNQLNYFSELTVLVPYKSNSLVAGINFIGDRFKKLPSDAILLSDVGNDIVGAFVQNTWNIADKVVFEAGLRDDYHFQYGNFILPRLAVFYRLNSNWAMRSGFGMGYKTPSALTSQLIDYDIEKIEPISSAVKSESSVGYNLEVNYKTVWGNGNSFFINHAFFLTSISNPIVATEQQISGNVSFNNATAPLITKGFDTYVKMEVNDWELYAGYTFTIAERTYLAQNNFVPLTPKNKIAFTLVHDVDEIGLKVGLEGSYTSSQYRLDATKTPAYPFFSAMVEKSFGEHFSVVLNAENLLDYRQSNVESLYTGTITQPNFNPIWAPIDGRVVNLSVKYKL